MNNGDPTDAAGSLPKGQMGRRQHNDIKRLGPRKAQAGLMRTGEIEDRPPELPLETRGQRGDWSQGAQALSPALPPLSLWGSLLTPLGLISMTAQWDDHQRFIPRFLWGLDGVLGTKQHVWLDRGCKGTTLLSIAPCPSVCGSGTVSRPLDRHASYLWALSSHPLFPGPIPEIGK